MASSHVEIFNSLRTHVLNALVDSRHSIDDSFGALPEPIIRRHFRSLLEQMQRYLLSPSPVQLHQSVSKWSALLLGLGLSPRSVLRSVVTFGDLIVQTSKDHLVPGKETNLFIREIVRLNFNAVRNVVAIFNAELLSLKGSHVGN